MLHEGGTRSALLGFYRRWRVGKPPMEMDRVAEMSQLIIYCKIKQGPKWTESFLCGAKEISWRQRERGIWEDFWEDFREELGKGCGYA